MAMLHNDRKGAQEIGVDGHHTYLRRRRMGDEPKSRPMMMRGRGSADMEEVEKEKEKVDRFV
jgi:hypothetical protein